MLSKSHLVFADLQYNKSTGGVDIRSSTLCLSPERIINSKHTISFYL